MRAVPDSDADVADTVPLDEIGPPAPLRAVLGLGLGLVAGLVARLLVPPASGRDA